MAIKHTIYTTIMEKIINGQLVPGERLTEATLSKEFSCSRSPIREALNRLDHEGFVSLFPNQGAVVTKVSANALEDYYSLLQLLEGTAVEWAVPFFSQSDLNRLMDINNTLSKLSRDDENFMENWMHSNLEFHKLFRDKSGNNKIDQVINDIRLRITRYRYTAITLKYLDEYIRDHEAIINAVRKKNAQEAKDLMAKHILRVKEALMDILRHIPGF